MSPKLAAFLAEHAFPSDDLSAPQADGRFTPLMRAAKLGRLDIVDELLALGVDIEVVNADGCNALWLACYSGSHEIIERLIAAGISIDRQNGSGANASLKNFDDFSALDLAASVACLKLLREVG